MEKERCGWSHQNEAMTRYHDEVWACPFGKISNFLRN